MSSILGSLPRLQEKGLCKPSPGRMSQTTCGKNTPWEHRRSVRLIPEGYVIIEMYNTSCNERHQPVRGGVLINDENY